MQSQLGFKMDRSFETKYNTVMESPFNKYSPAQKKDQRFKIQPDV